MSRVLILGGTGMLGHRMAMVLAVEHEVAVTVRSHADRVPWGASVRTIAGCDLRDVEVAAALIDRGEWDVVINAAGVIKQRDGQHDAAETVAVNALLPQRLAVACARAGVRFVHFSTDCVFSGTLQSERGANGYRLEDPADARDFYGLSKLLGEPRQPRTLCLRMSLIGPELRGHHGLLDWYLHRSGACVGGYTQAWFNGLTTPVASRLVAYVLQHCPDLEGLWHVGSEPISKHDLLCAVRARFGRGGEIHEDDAFYCDRRLDATAFVQRTGWQAPGWDEMLDELARIGVAQ